MSSDFIETSPDYVLPEAKIFQNRMQERKEAVQSEQKFAEFVAKELRRQEEQEIEKKKLKATRAKKPPKQKPVCKRPRRKLNRSKYCESSDSEKSDVGNSSVEKTSTLVEISSDESFSESDSDFSATEISTPKASSPQVADLQLSQGTKRRLKQQHDQRQKEMAAFNLEASDDDDDIFVDDIPNNPDPYEEINLKISCKGKVLHKLVKRSSTFTEVFRYISEENNVPISNVLIYHNDIPVDIQDTIKGLEICTADILNCVIMSPDTVKNQNCIEVKIQSSDSKTKTVMFIHKLDPMLNVMQKYADDKGLKFQTLIFEFDGDKILPNQTPLELEMEDESIIDVKIMK